jgi:hypothetical protein
MFISFRRQNILQNRKKRAALKKFFWGGGVRGGGLKVYVFLLNVIQGWAMKRKDFKATSP